LIKKLSKMDFKKLKFYSFITFFILSLSLILFSGLFHFNLTSIGSLLERYDNAASVIYVTLITLATATTLPINVTILSGMLVFPVYYIILLTLIGVLIGVHILFYMSRNITEDEFRRYTKIRKDKLKDIVDLLRKDSLAFVVLLTFVYAFPSNLAGMIAGFTKMKLYKFVTISIIGHGISATSVILMVHNLYIGNSLNVAIFLTILILNTLIPIIIFRKSIKDVFDLAFKRYDWEIIP